MGWDGGVGTGNRQVGWDGGVGTGNRQMGWDGEVTVQVSVATVDHQCLW